MDSPIISRRYGSVGKPDYLVEILDGKRRLVIPVEVKSRTKPSTPYASHILQLATYCLLVEDRYRVRPPYGLLHYADATLEIPFDDAIRRDVLAVAEKIRAARSARRLGREHNDAGRCRACGYLQACGNEALTVESEPNPPASAA